MLIIKELIEIEAGKLGNAIRTARIAKHLSQEELAEIVEVTPTHLKHIESEHRNPSLEVLWKLATILNLSLDDLLFPSPDERSALYLQAKILLKQCNEKQLKAAVVILEEILKL